MPKRTGTLLLYVLLIMAAAATAATDSTLSSRGLERLLASHLGKVVLVDYWATWCPPCRTDVPALNGLYQRYREEGLVVVGVSLDRDERAVEEFIRNHDVSYPMYMAGDDLRRSQRIMLLPTTVLVNQSGDVSERFQGSVSADRLEREIRTLLYR